MQRVRGARRERNLRVTGDLDSASRLRVVRDVQPAQLDVVFRRYGDLGMRFVVVVAPPKLRARLAEDRLGGKLCE